MNARRPPWPLFLLALLLPALWVTEFQSAGLHAPVGSSFCLEAWWLAWLGMLPFGFFLLGCRDLLLEDCSWVSLRRTVSYGILVPIMASAIIFAVPPFVLGFHHRSELCSGYREQERQRIERDQPPDPEVQATLDLCKDTRFRLGLLPEQLADILFDILLIPRYILSLGLNLLLP